MASIRAGSLLRSIGRAPPVWRSRPALTTLDPLPHRFAHSESRAPYKKAENVGDKPFSQFDLGGKVFVVTGTASRLQLSFTSNATA